MKFITGLLFSVLTSYCLAQSNVSIIPKPVSLQMETGFYAINAKSTIGIDINNKALQQAAKFLSAAIQQVSGIGLKIASNNSSAIQLVFSNTVKEQEGYELGVHSTGIIIKAKTKAGLIYGIQSLLQTLPQIRTNASIQVPCMQEIDYPRFKWRGMHLDVSRHFFGPEVIKEYINLMAAYKMNVFHWHLVDDQGWRIEIKKYPALTNIGAWRVDQTNKVWGDRPQAKPNETPTYGGFYTQAQLKEIVAYAQSLNITIVPEIEMPGHAAAAIASYPELSCTQKPQLPLTGGNYTNVSSNYCAGNDQVISFLQDILTEVMAIFPAEYLHIGGDEVDKAAWKICPKCQAKMKQEGLKDENELQSYFIKKIEKFLVAHHKKMIGWDEILEGGLAPEASVMSWRGEAGGIEAAKMKHSVVMTPGSPCYFDNYQAGPEGEPLAIGGFNTLKKVYDYEPIPKELNSQEAQFVLGAQGNLWTEFISTTEQLEYMVLPRMLALSEVLWTPSNNKNFTDFNNRLQYHFRGFEQKGLHYCAGNFSVAINPISSNGKLNVSLSTEILNAQIHYTIDGSEPTTQSPLFSQPIAINSSVQLRAVTTLNNQVMSKQSAKQDFVLHQAIGTAVNYTTPFSKYYPADGPNTLTDGVRGTFTIGKNWHGFSEKNLIATIDLGSAKLVKTIALGCLQKYRDWIFLPQSVNFETSTDGVNFTAISSIKNPYDSSTKEIIHSFEAVFTPTNIRYIRVTATNNLCPPGHPGAGKPAWIFADELIVK